MKEKFKKLEFQLRKMFEPVVLARYAKKRTGYNFCDNDITVITIASEQRYLQDITGRRAPKKLMRIGDLVNEVKEIKHYFNRGVKGRTGIER